MLIELRSIGIDKTKRRFLKPELAQLCDQNRININIINQNIEQGWCGRPKDLLQFIFEHVTKPTVMRYSKDIQKEDINVEMKILKDECK